MSAVVGFLRFCYDFLVGDAWEVAAGVIVGLVLTWAVVRAGGEAFAWIVLPVVVAIALGGSLYWEARRR